MLVLKDVLFTLAVPGTVTVHEEPTPRRQFGEPYRQYCASVGRWWPRRGGRGPRLPCGP